MKRWLMLLPFMPSFVSCSHAEPAATGASEPAAPVQVAAAAPRGFRANWAGVPEGAPPPDFVDVRQDGHAYPWLYDGGWRVSHRGGSSVLEVPLALTVPREPLSFRRFDGKAFGANGALPMRYRIVATARSLGGSTRFNGYGEVAIQALYRSPVTYVEVLQTDGHLYLWEAREAPPMQGKGWKQLAKVPNPTRVGEWVTFGAEVDRHTGRITALLDGKAVASATSSLITSTQPARFTIRTTGNKEEWRELEVREMP